MQRRLTHDRHANASLMFDGITALRCLPIMLVSRLQEEVDNSLAACERAAADALARVKRAAGNSKMGCRQLQEVVAVRAQIVKLQTRVSAAEHLLQQLEASV